MFWDLPIVPWPISKRQSWDLSEGPNSRPLQEVTGGQAASEVSAHGKCPHPTLRLVAVHFSHITCPFAFCSVSWTQGFSLITGWNSFRGDVPQRLGDWGQAQTWSQTAWCESQLYYSQYAPVPQFYYLKKMIPSRSVHLTYLAGL